MEAAAGIAGLIKVILSLEHEELPKHLNFQHPSPHIPWDRLPVRVVQEATPWKRNGRPRVAGVSSFGFSGTNAHVILQEAPQAASPSAAPVPVEQPDDGRFQRLAPFGTHPGRVGGDGGRYRDWLTANPDATLSDVCFTAGVGRSHLEHRAALVVNSTAPPTNYSVRSPTIALHRDWFGENAAIRRRRPGCSRVKAASTQEWPGSCSIPSRCSAQTVNRCAAAVADVLERPLLDVIFDTDGDAALRHTAFAQPALFAVEMGLARLWQSWGIEPDVVLGHSVGQYSAACVAGVFGLEDGALLLAERGRLFGSLPAGGRMVAAFADAERVERLHRRVPASGSGGLQRCQHRTVRPGWRIWIRRWLG